MDCGRRRALKRDVALDVIKPAWAYYKARCVGFYLARKGLTGPCDVSVYHSSSVEHAVSTRVMDTCEGLKKKNREDDSAIGRHTAWWAGVMRVKCESECVIDDSRKDSQLFTDRNADRDLCRVHFEELSCVSEKNNDGWKRRRRECSPINATKTESWFNQAFDKSEF